MEATTQGSAAEAAASPAPVTSTQESSRPNLSINADVSESYDPTATSSAKSSERPGKTRRRSSSNVLTRLVSRASTNEPTSPTSPKGSGDPSLSPAKVDRAALEKPKGKYKSGANWNVPGLTSPLDEPWMDMGAAPGEDAEKGEQEAGQQVGNGKAAEPAPSNSLQMLGVGGTAAAKAYAAQSAFGNPLFAAHQRATLEANLQARMQSSQAPAQRYIQAPSSDGHSRSRDGSRRPSFANSQGNRSNPNLRNGLVMTSVDSSQDKMVVEAAQRVLAAARLAAQGKPISQENVEEEQRLEAARSSPEIPFATGSPDDRGSGRSSPAASLKSRRKSFFSFGSNSRNASAVDVRSSKKGGSKPSSRRESRSEAGPPSPEQILSDARSIDSAGTNASNAGTAGRRRRWKDTRQLDLLASEIAAEALLGGVNQDAGYYSGSHTPEARRTSMLSVLASQPGNGAPGDSSALVPLSPLPMPQPPFAAGGYAGSSPGSSRHGSPRAYTGELPRAEGAGSGSRTPNSASVASSPYATQSAKLNGLPSDMLTGLGDGPYPSLPARRMEGFEPMADPFGIPIASESPYDISSSYANRTSVYHTPAQINGKQRLLAASGSTSGSTTPGANAAAKRSVLTMSMHSPETEGQGLIKPIKSGKNSPFGSRAPSRTVTPSQSSSGLREKAKADAVKLEAANQKLAKEKAKAVAAEQKAEEKQKRAAAQVKPPTPPAADTAKVAQSSPLAAAPVVQPVKSEPSRSASAPPARPPARSRLSFFGSKKSSQKAAAGANDSVPPVPKIKAELASTGPKLRSMFMPGSKSAAPTIVSSPDAKEESGATNGVNVLNKVPSEATATSASSPGLAPSSGLASTNSSSVDVDAPGTLLSTTVSRGRPGTQPRDAMPKSDGLSPASAATPLGSQMAASKSTPSLLRANAPKTNRFSRLFSKLSSSPSVPQALSPSAAKTTASGSGGASPQTSTVGAEPTSASSDAATLTQSKAAGQEGTSSLATSLMASAAPGKEGLPATAALRDHSPAPSSSSHLRLAQAYLNEDMAKQGFGTRSAYSSSEPAAVANGSATSGNAAAGGAAVSLMPAFNEARSVSPDARTSGVAGSLDGTSPYTSESSQDQPDNGSGGSLSTRSTDTSSAGMAVTPTSSVGLVAKTDLTPLSDSDGFHLAGYPGIAKTAPSDGPHMPGALLATQTQI